MRLLDGIDDLEVVEDKTTDLSYIGGTTTIANDLLVSGSITNSNYQGIQSNIRQITYGGGTTSFSGGVDVAGYLSVSENIFYEGNKNVSYQLGNLNEKTQFLGVENNITTLSSGLNMSNDILVFGQKGIIIGETLTDGAGISIIRVGTSIQIDNRGENNNDSLIVRGDITTGTTERLRMKLKTGNLGINQSNPSQKLHIVGNQTTTGWIKAGGTISATSLTGSLDASQITGIIDADRIPATLNSATTISGGNGECRLFLKADANNNSGGENENPRIVFTQDGNLYEGSIGLGNNELQLRSAVSGTNGIAFFTKNNTNNTNGSEVGLNEAYLRMRIDGTGKTTFWEDLILTAGTLSARKDTDTTHYLGKAFVGNAGISDAACFGHMDFKNATDCAFRQEANGDTYIGADNGNRVYITEGGEEVASFYRLNKLFGVSNSYMTLDDIVASAYASTLRISATSGRGIVCVGTSLLRNKRDIEDTDPMFIKNVIDNLRPRFYRYTDQLVPEPSKKEWSQVGLIAEEVVEADRRLATFEEDGETLNGVDYEKVSVYLLAHIKDNLEPKITSLERSLKSLTERVAFLENESLPYS